MDWRHGAVKSNSLYLALQKLIIRPRKSVTLTAMMPQGLPTSETLPVSDQSPTFKQSMCHSKEDSGNQLVTINANSVMTSIKQGTGTTNMLTTSMLTVQKPVDVLVISHEHESHNISDNFLEQTSFLGKPGYRLSELVTQQNLFHSPSDDTELEPVRPDVLSVRRRNRQFFTLLEEEEKENGGKELTEEISGDPHSDTEKKLHIQPVFSLGNSMRKLYYPNHNNRQKQHNHADGSHPVSESHSSASDVFEPEDTGVLYEKVVQMAGMRRIQSHPELHELADMKTRMNKSGEIFDPFDNYGLSKPKSVPTTPLLGSPNTIRKHMQSADHTHGDIKTPGYSFLASVADELRSINEKISINARHRSHEPIHAHQSVEKIKTQNVAHISETSAVVAASNTGTSVTQSGSLNSSAAHLELDDKHGGIEKSSGFVHFLKSLATNKPVNVSSKECNMFSPQSF